MTRLKGKVAIVTGGGSGIGRAIALVFGREGASVAVPGRRREALEGAVKELAALLASDQASWITGTAIPVDGGLTAY